MAIAQLESLVLDEPLRHPAEPALIALHEGAGADARYAVSLVAATCFLRLGVGYEVLRRQIAVEPPGSFHLLTVFNYLGDTITRTEDIPGARRLFRPGIASHGSGLCRIRAQQLREVQPVGPGMGSPIHDHSRSRSGGICGGCSVRAVLASTRQQFIAGAVAFWINDYKFGGKPGVKETQEVRLFFNLMNEAHKAGLKQFDGVMDNFEASFRRLVRSRNVIQVLRSVGLIETAADARYIRRKGLASELFGSVHSAEWKEFAYGETLKKPMCRSSPTPSGGTSTTISTCWT